MQERRRTPKPRLTIGQVLDYLQAMADDDFDGNVENHALTLFNRLSVDDKRTFLRKSLKMLWEHQLKQEQNGLAEIIVEPDLRISQDAVAEERQNIANSRYTEQTRFRRWLVKMIFSFMVLMLFLVVGVTYYFDVRNESSGEWLQKIDQMLKLIL